jgi:excisionase family DNA binding protein
MSPNATVAVDDAVDHQDPAGGIADQLALILAMMHELCLRIDGRIKSHYTVDEVAELTGRAPYTVRTWIHDGRLAAIRVPGTGPKGRLLVPHDELRRLVADGRAGDVPTLVVDLPRLVDRDAVPER